MIQNQIEADYVSVQDFYANQSILLTGATGFLGKAITEKLLRTCPNIKRIFLLIRTKKGKEFRQRTNELFNDPVFGPMRKENPNFLDKVIIIPGDVSLPDNGISESDWEKLTNEVTIVFHGAATVRFDEKLKTAVDINISGTKELLRLCGECRNLKALVHVSTAYANCHIDEINEEIYPPPITGGKIIDLTECLPENMLERCTSPMIQGWPNTYAFTKQIAEDLVRTEANARKIPAAILRPAIVIGSYTEPIPGWIDNVYGATGVTAAVGAGLLRTMHANADLRAELVPVDMTVNAALVIAWEVARINRNNPVDTEIPTDTIPVYNYVSSKTNPLTWGNYMKFNMQYGHEVPTIKAVWYYSLTITRYFPVFYLYCLILHTLPALIIDSVLMIILRKPQALKIYRKVQKFLGAISYFATKEWNFRNDNVVSLWKKLPEKDKKLFNFDMDSVDWDLYFKNNVNAIRVFLFKDTPDTLPAARRRMFMFGVLHRVIQIIFISLIIWILWSPIMRFFNYIINILLMYDANIIGLHSEPLLAGSIKSQRLRYH